MTEKKGILDRFLLLGVSHPMASFLFLLMLTGFSVYGLKSITIDTGFSSLIPDDEPDKLAYDRISREFGSDNRTIIYIRDKAGNHHQRYY